MRRAPSLALRGDRLSVSEKIEAPKVFDLRPRALQKLYDKTVVCNQIVSAIDAVCDVA
jgi:hypothetical protein